MRNLWMTSMVLVAAGCAGGVGSTPWDKNRDGLIGACEGLNRQACAATAGCEGQELACLAICQSDGVGGCLPCPSDFQCVSVTPTPPPVSCALLPVGLCAIVPACEVQSVTVCSATVHAPDDSQPETGCGGGCTTVQICANRPSQSCENTPVDSCTSNPACELESGPVCEIACLVGTDCPPCATPSPRCVTRPVVDACGSLSDTECTAAAGCRLDGAVCSLVCEDDGKGGCKPCPGAPTRCVALEQPVPVPVSPPAGGK